MEFVMDDLIGEYNHQTIKLASVEEHDGLRLSIEFGPSNPGNRYADMTLDQVRSLRFALQSMESALRHSSTNT